MKQVNRVRAHFEQPYRFGEIAEQGSLDVPLPAHPGVVLDEKRFLYLLRASISFGYLEKIGLIACIATLRQKQIDGMMSSFEREFVQFSTLACRETGTLKRLEQKTADEWRILCDQLIESGRDRS